MAFYLLQTWSMGVINCLDPIVSKQNWAQSLTAFYPAVLNEVRRLSDFVSHYTPGFYHLLWYFLTQTTLWLVRTDVNRRVTRELSNHFPRGCVCHIFHGGYRYLDLSISTQNVRYLFLVIQFSHMTRYFLWLMEQQCCHVMTDVCQLIATPMFVKQSKI